MASAQAQAFFDKQSAADRMKIIDSWGGRDMTDEWFKNAQAAGSVPAAAAPGAAPSVADVRASTTNASEDFARFNDATVEGWGKFYDAAASKAAGRPQYRSSRGAPGTFDKPTECPPGQGPQGGSESDPCGTAGYSTPAPWEQGGAPGAGAAGAAGAQGASAGYFGQDDPLQRMLVNQMASAGGSFAGTTSGGQFAGGGVFSEGAGQYGKPATTGTATPNANPAATAALGALAPAPAPAATPFAPKAPEPASYSDPYEAWKQGGRKGPAPGSSAIALPAQAQPFVAPAAAKPADVFGTAAPAAGSLAQLVNPGRAKRDARMGGSWF